MKAKFRIFITLILILIFTFIFTLFNKKQNVNKIYPSIVHLECKNDRTTTVGTGIVYKIKNDVLYIVTNYHIVKGYSQINAYDESFNQEKVKIINYDENNDIAILAVKNNLNVKKATFDLKNKISKHDDVYVLTSFIGSDSSYIVKDAIVSDVSSTIKLDNKEFNTIKLSYDIESGDSGSPVINKNGKVIGIVFLKDTDVLHYGYALPINFVFDQIYKLENVEKKIQLGALMTNSTNSELINEYKINPSEKEGIIILSIKKNYPLDNAGLRKGDLIVDFNGNEVKNIDQLQKYLDKCKKNSQVSIKYYRENKLYEATMKLDK